jgi:hypothetical protein
MNCLPQRERDYYAKLTQIVGLSQILKGKPSKDYQQFDQD